MNLRVPPSLFLAIGVVVAALVPTAATGQAAPEDMTPCPPAL